MNVLVYLNWPERCFRASPDDLAFLKGLLPRGAKVAAVRSDRAFLRALPSATHVITWHFRQEWYAKAGRLQVLATPSAGRELVARDAPPGVRVHFGGFHGAIMSEAVAAFVLAWAHGFFAVREYAGYGGTTSPAIPDWPRAELGGSCFTVAGTRAAIVGYGRVGRAIGEKLTALGVKVTGYRRANIADLDAELPNLDWLVLALPSDTGTDGFLSAARLRKLPRRAVVVNVGRGNAIDDAALLAALRSRRIAGAYLDVFKGEPGPLAKIIPPAGPVPNQPAGSVPTVPPLSLLGTDPNCLPNNLIRMPHSSAFANDYLRRCFQELKDDGCL